jgi:hypothetical protein
VEPIDSEVPPWVRKETGREVQLELNGSLDLELHFDYPLALETLALRLQPNTQLVLLQDYSEPLFPAGDISVLPQLFIVPAYGCVIHDYTNSNTLVDMRSYYQPKDLFGDNAPTQVQYFKQQRDDRYWGYAIHYYKNAPRPHYLRNNLPMGPVLRLGS